MKRKLDPRSLEEIATQIVDAWGRVSKLPGISDDDLATISTHIAISLRLMSATNPSKLISITKTVEIAHYLNPGVKKEAEA